MFITVVQRLAHEMGWWAYLVEYGRVERGALIFSCENGRLTRTFRTNTKTQPLIYHGELECKCKKPSDTWSNKQQATEEPATGGCWKPPKIDTPYSKTKKKPQ